MKIKSVNSLYHRRPPIKQTGTQRHFIQTNQLADLSVAFISVLIPE